MKPVRCEELDDYLGGELSGPRRALFELHLSECAACREEVEQFGRLGALLERAIDAEEHADAPRQAIGLALRVRREVAHDHQRRLRTRIVFGAASLVLLGTLGWQVVGWLRPSEVKSPGAALVEQREAGRRDVERSDPPRTGAAPGKPVAGGFDDSPAPAVEVSFLSDVIAVPIESGDPSVTIYWVYPTSQVSAAAD